MIILRKTIRIQPNLTDRAKRYRAQHPSVRPLAPKQCGFCGSKRNIGVHHVSGHEEDGDARNLMWACKSCNGAIAHRMRKAGLGKLTAQYNPKRHGSTTMAAYDAAIKVMRGEWEGDISKAMHTIHASTPAMRSRYTAKTWPIRRQKYGPSGRSGGGKSEVPF